LSILFLASAPENSPQSYLYSDTFCIMYFELFSVLLFGSQAVALGLSTQTTTQCFTKLATKSVQRVPTSSKTVTIAKLPTVIISTKRSTQNYTPSATTTTLTESVTVTSTTTDSTVTGKNRPLRTGSRLSYAVHDRGSNRHVRWLICSQ
jgi:lipoprotein-anchoring transpeptidase ErfK/SrfK